MKPPAERAGGEQCAHWKPFPQREVCGVGAAQSPSCSSEKGVCVCVLRKRGRKGRVFCIKLVAYDVHKLLLLKKKKLKNIFAKS